MILASRVENKKGEPTPQMSDLCRRKLLGYAESFQELANSFEDKFVGNRVDRTLFLEEKRSWENQKIISENLNEMAQIIERVAKEDLKCKPVELRYRRQVSRELREEGIFVDNMYYFPCESGQQAVGMTLWTAEKGGIPTTEVADMLSVLLHKPLQASTVTPYLVDEQKRSFLFVEEARYIALTGFAKVVRENELVSGDNYAFLESEKGKMTIILSDGTGSGEKASRDSGQVLDLMEKMLEAGYGVEAALRLVNSILYAKAEDGNHPTLDVCELDLHQGSCDFYKVGGALSFVKRGSAAEVVEENSLPLGIFRQVPIERLSKQLQEGDFVIMLSDGVLDAFGEEDYEEILLHTIEGLTEQNPGELAEKLLHYAICSCGGHIGDDMTIIVAGIWENSVIS